MMTNYVLDDNAEYTNYAGSNKNCYLLFNADGNRDCYYGYGARYNIDCLDILYNTKCELCYSCIDCTNCYNLTYSQDCMQCYDSLFVNNCISCKNYYCCKNIVQKEYCVFNKQLTKVQYNTLMESIDLGKWSNVQNIQKEFLSFAIQLPNKNLKNIKTENCSGDYLKNSKNVMLSYDIYDGQDLKYCYGLDHDVKDCMDVNTFGLNIQLVCESSNIGYNASNILFTYQCSEEISHLIYCFECFHIQHCFGCVGLHHKQYCIFNKQYTKEEYESLVPQIIEKEDDSRW